MAEANDQFRAARERTASPTHQGVCLSRQELADLVNTWVWEHHNEKVVLATANYIGKLETGIIRCTAALSLGTLTRGPLAALLNGIAPPPTPKRVSATDIEQIRTPCRYSSHGTAPTAAGQSWAPLWASCTGQPACWTPSARNGYARSCTPHSAISPM
ncbi:MAG: hypothetical protein ACRDQ4_09015 [Pseudonocardiaceae bacterium]